MTHAPSQAARGLALFTLVTLILAPLTLTRAEEEPSLDDLLDIPKKSTTPDKDKPADKPKDDTTLPIDPQVTEPELSPEEAADAFKTAVADMTVVADRLNGDRDAGLDTQRMQESILARLDKVLAAAKKQQNQGGKGGGKSGQNKPQQQQSGNRQNAGKQGAQQQASSRQNGKQSAHGGTKGDVAGHESDPNNADPGDAWGHLPPRLRDELIQGRDDRFSATYKSLTQEYYRRLAEEGR